MALKDTIKNVKELLSQLTHDLEKADRGNKAASQRVRTGTVKLEKIAKLYRKESIKSEKGSKGTAKKPAKKAASKTASAKKSTAAKGNIKAKGKAKTTARPRAFSVKRPTAKLPTRHA